MTWISAAVPRSATTRAFAAVEAGGWFQALAGFVLRAGKLVGVRASRAALSVG
jgi:hypothetical protein